MKNTLAGETTEKEKAIEFLNKLLRFLFINTTKKKHHKRRQHYLMAAIFQIHSSLFITPLLIPDTRFPLVHISQWIPTVLNAMTM